jgi:hypothetical protein
MRLLRSLSVATALLLATAGIAAAQGSNAGFDPGYTDIGPVIGLGGIGDAGISIGGRFEHAIKTLPDLGNGILSIAASVDHYSFDDSACDALGFDCGFSYTPVGVTVNYHFHLDNRQWDPFVGVGLGDYFVSEPDSCRGFCHGFNSGVYFIGRLGVRYFWQPKLALYADVGSGAGALHVGVMFKIK